MFIGIGILFDMIGISITVADLGTFNSMATKNVRGASLGVKMIQKADKMSSFCNDVVGDICGIISGSAGVTIVALIIKLTSCNEQFTPFVEIACVFHSDALLVGQLDTREVVGVRPVEPEQMEGRRQFVAQQHVAYEVVVVVRHVAGRSPVSDGGLKVELFPFFAYVYIELLVGDLRGCLVAEVDIDDFYHVRHHAAE